MIEKETRMNYNFNKPVGVVSFVYFKCITQNSRTGQECVNWRIVEW